MVLLVVDAQNGIVDERLYEFRKFGGICDEGLSGKGGDFRTV